MMLPVAVCPARRYNHSVSKKRKKERKSNPRRAFVPASFSLVAGILGLSAMIMRWRALLPEYEIAVALVGFGMAAFTLIGVVWTIIRVADDWEIIPRRFLYAILLMVLPALIHLIWMSQYLSVLRESEQVLR